MDYGEEPLRHPNRNLDPTEVSNPTRVWTLARQTPLANSDWGIEGVISTRANGGSVATVGGGPWLGW